MRTHVVARLGGLFTAMSALFLSTASAVDITVDMTTPYQRMEGFGVLGRMKPWKIRQGPFLIDVDLDAVGIYDSLVSELGATLFRTDLTGKVQPDSGVWDFSVLQGQHEPFYTLRRFREAAERHNEPIYLFGHVWSPPGWMKVCGTEECPGGVARSDCALKDGYQDDLGRHLLRLVRTFHDSTGIEHYAVSVQDEPSFQHAFASCVYTGQTYVQALKGVASVFRENSYSMRFFGAEHVAGEYPTEYDRAVRADPVALEYLYAWAVHGYYSEDLWRRAYADTGSYNGSTPTQKPFWVTTHRDRKSVV
jgi:O-glycosyl hydrolase